MVATEISPEEHLKACPWRKYREPETERVWYWNVNYEDWFFQDEVKLGSSCTSGWCAYFDSTDRQWYYNINSKEFFYDDYADLATRR